MLGWETGLQEVVKKVLLLIQTSLCCRISLLSVHREFSVYTVIEKQSFGNIFILGEVFQNFLFFVT